MGKILVFASVAISLATAGLGFVNKGKLGETKESLATAESGKQAAEQKASVAEKSLKTKSDELTTAVAEKEQAVAQASQAKSDLDKATASLSEATTKATTAESALAQAQAENETLKKQVADASATPGTAPAAGPDAETLAKLQEQETLIQSLQSQLDSTKVAVKQADDEKKMRLEKTMKKGTEGRVLAVNPAWNFVVLNLGDKQGVVNNAELLVKRGTRYLGKVRVTSVEPSTSIADIVANSMPQGTTITPGDNVIFQGNEE